MRIRLKFYHTAQCTFPTFTHEYQFAVLNDIGRFEDIDFDLEKIATHLCHTSLSRKRYIPIDREIFQGNAIAILNGYRLYSIVHDELRAVPVDSDIVKPLEKHCQSLRKNIVGIGLIIIFLMSILRPKIITSFGKDKGYRLFSPTSLYPSYRVSTQSRLPKSQYPHILYFPKKSMLCRLHLPICVSKISFPFLILLNISILQIYNYFANSKLFNFSHAPRVKSGIRTETDPFLTEYSVNSTKQDHSAAS